MRGVVRSVLAAGLAVAAAGTGATERLVFRLDVRNGLPASRVLALAQDPSGFVWIGTEAGLARYDGVAVRPWARDALRRVDVLAAGPDGLLAGWRGETLYRVRGDEAQAVPGPDGGPLDGLRDAAYDDASRLWVATRDGLFLRATDGRWSDRTGAIGGEAPRRLDVGAGALHALTDGGVWRVDADTAADADADAGAGGPGERLLARRGLVALEATDDGAVWSAEFCCRVFETRDGRTETRLDATDRSPLRAIAMAERGGTVWLSFDRLLVAFRPDGPVDVLDSRDGIRGGGPLLVDAERSLWLGTELGVARYPEPDTAMWTDHDGLPRAFEALARRGDALLVSGWDGIGRLDLAPARPRATRALDLMASYPFCADAAGRTWIGGLLDPYGPRRGNVVAELAAGGGAFRLHGRPQLGNDLALAACAPAADGTVWIALGKLLLRSPPGGGDPVEVADLARLDPAFARGPRALLEDSGGTLWLTDGARVCRLGDGALRCELPPDAGEIFELHEAAPGEIWIATRDAGALARAAAQDPDAAHRRDGDGDWRAALPEGALPTSWVHGLAPARGGGVWILGDGMVLRAARDEGGWDVVERLGSWNGLPGLQAKAALEDADGTLWLASYGGVVRVPPAARAAEARAPRVEPVASRADGRSVELSYAALSFRAPESVRYRVRHRPDAPWSTTRNTMLRWVDLAPGEYAVEVQASLDGRAWSAEPARFAFTVPLPWYRQAWFLALAAAAGALLLYLGYRLRVAYLLGIERERSRIAVDLHDDMGSKLGSIGLLADLASDGSLDDGRRADLLQRVSRLAGEVGGALADIVWALRPGSTTLEQLAAHLAERGEELLEPRGIELRTEFPETWPATRLGLGVRRHVQLVGIEALHNAARHSGASQVLLALRPDGPHAWRLRVEDDGRATAESGERAEAAATARSPTGSRSGGGVGRTSMRARAERIGAELEWTLREEGGCRVDLRFDPRAADVERGG